MVYGFSHSLTLEAVASHHPISRIVSRGFISFDVPDAILNKRFIQRAFRHLSFRENYDRKRGVSWNFAI
jgi:hypothetical protein